MKSAYTTTERWLKKNKPFSKVNSFNNMLGDPLSSIPVVGSTIQKGVKYMSE